MIQYPTNHIFAVTVTYFGKKNWGFFLRIFDFLRMSYNYTIVFLHSIKINILIYALLLLDAFRQHTKLEIKVFFKNSFFLIKYILRFMINYNKKIFIIYMYMNESTKRILKIYQQFWKILNLSQKIIVAEECHEAWNIMFYEENR